MKFEAVSYSSGIQLSWSVLDTPFQRFEMIRTEEPFLSLLYQVKT